MNGKYNLTSVFASKDDADKLSAEVIKRIQRNGFENDEKNNTKKKYNLTSAFASKDDADKLSAEVIKRRQTNNKVKKLVKK